MVKIWVGKNNSRVPQESVLGSILFLIYIDGLPDGITSTRKIFDDDTFLFSKVLDTNKSASKLNSYLDIITHEVAYQWKMRFNPDLNKQAKEVIFSRKSMSNKLAHPAVNLTTMLLQNVPLKNIWELFLIQISILILI